MSIAPLRLSLSCASVALLTVAASFVTGSASAETSRQYAKVRGWTISSFSDQQGFLGCDGKRYSGGAALRLGFDPHNNIWAMGIRSSRRGDHQGLLAFDGYNETIMFRHFPDGWAMMDLSPTGLDNFRRGNRVGLDVGQGYYEFSLKGSAAAMAKVRECAQRQGRAPRPKLVQQATATPPAFRPAPAPRSQLSRAPATSNRGVPAARPAKVASVPAQVGGACPQGQNYLQTLGMCSGQAGSYIANPGLKSLSNAALAGCQVVVNEAALPGDEVLLYYAQKCKGKTFTLTFAGGAHRALLRDNHKRDLVELYHRDGKSPTAAILVAAQRTMTPAQKSKCFVQKSQDASPSFMTYSVTDLTPARAQQLAQMNANDPGGVSADCGDKGEIGDAYTYWRVMGDHVMYFDFGQDMLEVEPGSFTLLKRDASGQWQQVK